MASSRRSVPLCWLIGHQYRTSIPRVFEVVVYCKRCGREFAHTDSPTVRDWWEGEDHRGRNLVLTGRYE